MELSVVGGRHGTSQSVTAQQPPPPLHHHHHPHNTKQHLSKSVGRITKCPSSPTHQYPPPFVHKKQCRYPEDPDTIEIIHDDDPIKLKPTSKSMGRKTGKWAKANMNQYETSTTARSTSNINTTTNPPHYYFCHPDPSNPEYSYAYCEPIVTKLNKNIPTTPSKPPGIPTSISSNALSKGSSSHSLRALLTKSFRKSSVSNPSERHTFTTRYGKKENIYEDVDRVMASGGAKPKISRSSESVGKVPVEEELKFVQKQHDRIMHELNLSIEELLMPSQDETEQIDRRKLEEAEQQLDEACCDRFSPTQLPTNPCADVDSGISGSSSSGTSYSGSMRYRTGYQIQNLHQQHQHGRNITIFEGPSSSNSSSNCSQIMKPPPPSTMHHHHHHPPPSLTLHHQQDSNLLPYTNKLSCCFYGDDRPSGATGICRGSSNNAPIETISEKVNFWNKIGKIKGVFKEPSSGKQQSPTDAKGFSS